MPPGPHFEADLAAFENWVDKDVFVVHGDVVPCAAPAMFGVLSGDDLVVRLATEVRHVTRLVFLVGGVDGILLQPPDSSIAQEKSGRAVESDQKDMLIPLWSLGVNFEAKHDSEIDVTGGILLKANRGALVASHGIPVIIVNGGVTDRVLGAALGHPAVRGTRIISQTKQGSRL